MTYAVRRPAGAPEIVRDYTAPAEPEVPVAIYRNYAKDMRDVIDAAMEEVDHFNSTVMANDLVEKLKATDPGLLQGWLEQHAVQLLRGAIISIDRGHRTAARHNSERAAFSRAIQDHADGDTAALNEFRTGWLEARYFFNGERRPLADLTGAELTQVAEDYRARANSNLMESHFLKAIAKRCGDRKVSEVFDNERLHELRRSITGD